MPSVDGVLRILDASAEQFVFPMLDNGYIYPAAARLSVFSGKDGWAVVFENFGYFTRVGIPDTSITTIGEGIIRPEKVSDFISQQAFETFCRVNEFWRQDNEAPLEEGDWIDDENLDMMRVGCTAIPLRGSLLPIPPLAELNEIGQRGGIRNPFHLANIARFLSAHHRENILAVEEFKRIPKGWTQLLRLDEWRHPDVVYPECKPSTSATMRSLAEVIATGDASQYKPENPNTHWRHWPEGGTL